MFQLARDSGIAEEEELKNELLQLVRDFGNYFGELAERIRMELPHDYLLLHPRLCEENGENLMTDLLRDGVAYVMPACKEEKQKKLLRDAFQRANVTMDSNWKPVMISFKNRQQAFDDIQKALEEIP